ncbi:Npun_F5749 family FMN-dependent PPOX-type flavoprotein [Moorena sp. SIO3H5]|uniref:Npun_F5749 family FMN-dependent PPOX-type flavoprotein n=1 Tax=Moorena sp. SIO3H5 TaxID=2607834 RepID=UPI0013BD1419|nr:Npun_F5749 family FMN-dependent PPOX-type flavoprotein [Moorena sp. SIO3H5]NEO72916.1 pyridoxamine 5'-phosphate oxidase [Moorena sp. SIO3H5]
MPIALWRSPLARALHRNRSLAYARYFQLATVDPKGYPANRTVVFRGFLDNSNQLKVITDTRSQKIHDINHHPWGEVCWYFPNTREQFRLAGQLTLITADYPDEGLKQVRQQTWQNLSDAARLQFAWPDPGVARVADPQAFSPPPPALDQPLPNFCLLLLEPVKVDHLALQGFPQNRWLYYQDSSGEWFQKAVNP